MNRGVHVPRGRFRDDRTTDRERHGGQPGPDEAGVGYLADPMRAFQKASPSVCDDGCDGPGSVPRVAMRAYIILDRGNAARFPTDPFGSRSPRLGRRARPLRPASDRSAPGGCSPGGPEKQAFPSYSPHSMSIS